MNRIKELREARNIEQKVLAIDLGVSQPTISDWENDKKQPSSKSAAKLADYFDVSIDYLLGRNNEPRPRSVDLFPTEDITLFDVIGSVTAGYQGEAIEESTGDTIPIPTSFLRGHTKQDFFVLRIKGDSMYPRLLDGDTVLVMRTTSVDSGDIAVILYNGHEATVKKVIYKTGEDWLEMIPFNPEYQTKRIEGRDLEQCRVLGRVIKLIRDL